jgi:hypothetical protein
MRALLVLLLLLILTFSQETPEDFGRRVFKAVIANDKAAFETALAPENEFAYFFKQIDSTIPDSLFRPLHDRYVTNSYRGLALCREDIAELALDPQDIEISKVETEDHQLELRRNGQTFTPTVTTITIFFTCSGKNMAFMISDAITVNEKFYLGDRIVQFHWLD